jgi:hypothetical protein
MTSLTRRLICAVAALFLIGEEAEGQSDSVLTRVLSDSTSLLGRLHTDSSRLSSPRRPIGSIRLASATGGFMFGMLLGGYSGYEIASRDCEQCRNPTADGMLLGGAIGGALGAALGAAFLDLSSVCRFDGRIARTLIGSGIGATALFMAAGGLDKDGRSAFFIPIGAIGGSLGTLGRCWRSRY